jgi:signal transduction histidine kinase
MSAKPEQHLPGDGQPDDPLASDRLISYLRWLWLASVFLVAWLEPTKGSQYVVYVRALVAVGALLNLIQVVALFLRWYPGWMPMAAITFDTLLSILLLAATDRWQSPLLPALLFPVLVGSLRLGLEAGLASAVVIAFAYGGFAISDPAFYNRGSAHQVGVNVLLLMGAACISGLVYRQQKTTQERVELTELASLRRANERAKAIYEMASTLSATLNYKRVLTAMLELGMLGLTEVTGRDASLVGLILLFEQEGNPEKLKVHGGRNIPRSDENRIVSGQSGLIARAIYTAEPATTDQVSSDPVLSQFICMQNSQAVICAPLRAGFDSFGVVIFASSRPDYFTQDHGELLTTFCSQAVIALKNAQLYQDLQTEQRKILEKESEARHKLARELHDGPTQTISAVAMRLNFIRMMLQKRQNLDKVIEELTKVEELARKTTQEVRTMLFTLRPVVLETQGLAAALEQYGDRLRQTEELNVEVDAGNYDGQLNKQAESVAFAVVEEAVGNARKHAQASLIKIRLRVDDHLFTAEVRDDGVGFDVGEARRRREAGHMGLLNIEERAEMVGGRCSIQSQPGAGTLVRLDIPVRLWGGAE